MPTNPSSLPRRAFGNTDIGLSIIGLGGMLLLGETQEFADRIVAEAVERGVNYFDVAPSYGDAESRLGPALEPYRKHVFLACKSTNRTAPELQAELKKSLQTLRTDYFDLYQLHALTDLTQDVDAVFAKGGAMEYLIEAKKSGVVRHIGFSAHSVEAALTAMKRFSFDSILFPVNFTHYFAGNFGPQVIEKAHALGMAILAIKSLALQKWPGDCPEKKDYPKCWYQPVSDAHQLDLAFRFALSQPITAMLPPGNEKLFRIALDLAQQFTPITPPELKELEILANGLDPLFKA